MLRTIFTKVIEAAIYGLEPVALLLHHSFGDARISASVHSKEPCTSIRKGYHCRPEMSHHWGMYSPWFTAPSEISTDVPGQCNVTFVQVLSRHGSRYPTQGSSDAYRETIEKIHSQTWWYSEKYSFIRDYQYTLGSEDLTAFGAQELVFSGLDFFENYEQLSIDSTPFVRASGDGRVIASARNWTRGFHLAKTAHHIPDNEYPYDVLVINEASDSNDTLNHGLCDAFERGPYSKTGDTAKEEWLDIFVPSIMQRVNLNLRGADLNKSDILHLMDICPFETVAVPDGRISPFCDLFSIKEWQQYDYYETLDKYYGCGGGNYLGPTQGVGFVNELIARLSNVSVVDHTSVNHTLDDNPDTFPLGRPLYADFSHDNQMASIFFAMGLYNLDAPLSNTTLETPEQAKGFSAAYAIPFASRAYIEKLRCTDHTVEEMVRVIMNDRVMPLELCGSDSLGRCSLSGFIKSLAFAQRGGLWGECFA